MSVGLVLEGGGMRGIYTAGVLEYFMRKGIDFPYVAAVSAGACNAANFVSKQLGRGYIVLTKYSNDKRYISLYNLIKKGCIFDFDFVIDEIGHQLHPMDMNTFLNNPVRFVTGTTDCETAEPVYFEKEEYKDSFDCLRASCSQPFLAKMVEYKGMKLLDGGIADPIPIKRSISDGNDKNVIVLTRPVGYQKKREYSEKFCRHVYGDYPNLVKRLMERASQYNETLEFCYQLERDGKALIIQPQNKLPVNRLEKDKKKLTEAYRIGIQDAKRNAGKIQAFLGEK